MNKMIKSRVTKTKYCEIIVNRGVVFYVDFVVYLNHEHKNPTKYNFPMNCCLWFLKPRIQEHMDQYIL